MAVRPIVTYPNKILRQPTQKVQSDPEWLHPEIEDCFDTLYQTDRGAALAANQIGIDKRFFVISKHQKVPEGLPLVICNPEIIMRSDEKDVQVEGCLSFPGISMPVERSLVIDVSFMDTHGYYDQVELQGWMARVFQHEIDHLDGRLFVDMLPTREREKIARQVIENKKRRKR